MKIHEWLSHASKQLSEAGVDTARLDSLVLLEDVLNTNRTQLLAHPEVDLTDENIDILNIALGKRTHHTPLAYIRNKTEFYGREFYVDERVLEPRPESEAMIELLKHLELSAAPRIADVGTGSGAIGITAAQELPTATVDLLEIDSGALAVAQKNVRLHSPSTNITTHCVQSDLLSSSNEHYDVLLCNLPYVPDDFQINRAASHEPDLALFGGLDGLDAYRRLFEQLNARSSKPAHVLTEALPFQHQELTQIAHTNGYALKQTEDFIQHFIVA